MKKTIISALCALVLIGGGCASSNVDKGTDLSINEEDVQALILENTQLIIEADFAGVEKKKEWSQRAAQAVMYTTDEDWESAYSELSELNHEIQAEIDAQ